MPRSAHRKGKNEDRGERRQKWIGISLAAVLVLLLLIQAIMSLAGLKPHWGQNYYWQPVHPILQLAVAAAAAAVLVLWFVLRNRKVKERKRRRSRREPFIPGKVPDRWPWE